MSEPEIGETVELTAPDLLLADGSIALSGDRGTVVGKRGFMPLTLIVSWHKYGTTGECRSNDVRRIHGQR